MTQTSVHFALFGLPRSYSVDIEALDAAYEGLSLEYHPDFYSAAPEAERQVAEAATARTNEAYRVLASDSARAAYLLRLLANGRALDTRALPEGFLQEMFALQEQVDELDGPDGLDSTEGDEERATLRASLHRTVHGRLEQVLGERPQLFTAAAQQPRDEQLQVIQSNINCAHYLQRLCSRLHEPQE